MRYPKDDIEMKDYTNSSIKKSNKIFKNEDLENESTKNEEFSISSASSPVKKYGRKRITYSDINYSINNNPITDKKNKEKIKNELTSIKEEKSTNSKLSKISKNSKEDKDESFCLFDENKQQTGKKAENEIENETNLNNSTDKICQIIDEINKKKGENKKSSKKDYKKDKDEKLVTTDDEDENKKNSKKKEIKYPKKEEKGKDSKINTKNKLDLEFLNKEEKEKEKEGDFKTYIQKAFDEEDEYKIIYEFNKLPFKPKILCIDLNIFDENSILKCISYCYFDKKELRFILKLSFIYLSDKSELYSKKNNEEIIMNYFLEQEENKSDNNKPEEGVDNNNIDEYDIDNRIKLKVTLKRFRIIKGYDIVIASESKKINKNTELNGFEIIQFNETEDLVGYSNYHKIFYTLLIQKTIIMTSKKSLPEKKIGIQNEGNTCYMNSIIQSMYNNSFLLRNIMTININSEILLKEENKKNKDIIYALQNIFYKLKKNKYSIKIIEIFNAFQWKRTFWNSPQDAEEIYMEIYQIISLFNDEIKNNCEGILENTIEVKEIDYKSSKKENFFFLQLDIENNHSLEECLEYFFKSEELTGENKYQYIDDFGNKFLYDATKYYKFKKIPNILFIQLKRFQYDSQTSTFNKKNQGISFKEEINLTNYLDNNNNKTKSKKRKKETEKEEYILYCVIVHSGSAENGHYFCFVKDFKNNFYIKFNDTSVYLADKKEVFNHIFGGEEIEYKIKNISKNKDKPKYEVQDYIKEIKKNAYIFIYIKKNKIKELFNDDNDKMNKIFEEYSKLKKEEEQKNNGLKNNEDDVLWQYTSPNYNTKNTKKNYKRRTMLSHGNMEYKYNSLEQNQKSITYYLNKNKKMDINMKENNLDFSKMLSEMGNNVKECENLNKYGINNYNNKFSSKRKTMDYYNENKNYNKINNEKRIKPMYYPLSGLNDAKTYFYLIENISNKVKGMFLVKYNTKIKVKEVPEKIREQLNKEKNQDKNKERLEKIVTSPGYKLVLINSIGFFIKFLDEQDYDITHLIKNEDMSNKKNIKHLCLYNLTNLNKNEENKNIIVINFISNYLLDLIISKKEDIYENLNFDLINIPAFIINEKINGMNDLFNKIKDVYVNYFGSKAQKLNKFKIYVINNKDILNLDILKINYTELTEDNFLLYIDINLNYANLLVGYYN